MKYVVTGGAGFIGSHITEHLVNQGNEVTVIDNLITGKKENLKSVWKEIKFVKGSILDFDLLKNLSENVDGIFHEAALASVPDSFDNKEEYHNVNVNGTENILKLANEYGIKVVYASSSSVYGDPKQVPIKEDNDKNPVNPYAQTKLEAELLAEKYSKIGVQVIGLRYFNVFGRRQSKEYAGVISLFLDRIQQSESLKINGDGSQTRDFVYVKDVVKANIMAMDSNIKHEFFNIGTGYSVSILDLANMIIDASGLPLKPVHGPELPGDIKASEANLELIKKSLNWEPITKLEDWLIEVISSKNFKVI